MRTELAHIYWWSLREFSRANLRERLDEDLPRWIRARLRLPSLWARAYRCDVPSASLASNSALLDRPESIRLSADGSKLIVSNSFGRGVTVYALGKKRNGAPKLALQDAYFDKEKLHYAHGAVFVDSDSKYLAVGEYANTMMCLQAAGDTSGDSDANRLLWSIEGLRNGLDNPADIAVHPSGRYLVVANRKEQGLSFLALDGGFDAAPRLFSSLRVPALNLLGVAAPHGVCFSPDGEYLFVSHKSFALWGGDSGNSAITVYRANAEPRAGHTWAPCLIVDRGSDDLHHINIHPHLPLVAVTNSRGDLMLYAWDAQNCELSVVGSINVFRRGEGAKGLTFTHDGKYLAVTSELDEVLFFAIDHYLR